METVSLDNLEWKHGTDKSTRIHGFALAYDRLLTPLRLMPIRLLEIGVGSGGSLRAWRDYFPHAEIFGVDINPDVPRVEGVETIIGDQGDPSFLYTLVDRLKPLHVIVDDGSHLWGDQIFTFEQLFPIVEPDGFYIIEDLHTSYWGSYAKGPRSCIDYLKFLVDELNMYGRSGYGMPKNDPDFNPLMFESPICKDVERIEFYKGTAAIHKRGAE